MHPRKWTLEKLKKEARLARSYRDLLLRIGLRPAGGNYTQVQRALRIHRIQLPKYQGTGWNRGLRGIGKPRIELHLLLHRKISYQSYKLKRRLFSAGLKHPRCEICGWAKMSPDGRLPLELDHINGDRYDNRLLNLRILCPNCHSLQPTHRGLNIRKK